MTRWRVGYSRHVDRARRLPRRIEGDGSQVSAHCDDCGFDLPYEGDCLYCTARSKLDTAREALTYVTTANTLPAAKTTAEAGLRLSSIPTERTEDAD